MAEDDEKDAQRAASAALKTPDVKSKTVAASPESPAQPQRSVGASQSAVYTTDFSQESSKTFESSVMSRNPNQVHTASELYASSTVSTMQAEAAKVSELKSASSDKYWWDVSVDSRRNHEAQPFGAGGRIPENPRDYSSNPVKKDGSVYSGE